MDFRSTYRSASNIDLMESSPSECLWWQKKHYSYLMENRDDQKRNRDFDTRQLVKRSEAAESSSMTTLVRKMSLQFSNYRKSDLHAKILRVAMAERMSDRACSRIQIGSPTQQSCARLESRDLLRCFSKQTCSAKDDSEMMSFSNSFHEFRGGISWTLKESSSVGEGADIQSFIMFRVLDPSSYFYRFRIDDKKHVKPQKLTVHLVDIKWLKPHEQILSPDRVNGLKKSILAWNAYTHPLLVDSRTGAILDGHHRYTAAIHLGLQQVPAVLVDYLGDESITVDVWPECGRQTLTKYEVIDMALSPEVFPPKTSRHRFVEALPPISIPLSVLRTPPRAAINTIPTFDDHNVLNNTNFEDTNGPSDNHRCLQRGAQKLRRCRVSIRDFSIGLFCGAQNLAAKLTRALYANRIWRIENNETRYQAHETFLDIVKRPTIQQSASASFFDVIRVNDPSSSFCQQKARTLDDFLCSDAIKGITFYGIRVCDPTSYFYKFRLNACPQRSPHRAVVVLADINWLKPHEHVVSWDRVDGLRKATLRWNAYMEPLLIDSKTGAILDGHHRYHVGLQLHLRTVPVVLVDYLEDDTITVDVWPNCGRGTLTKEEVIQMSLSEDVFPPKTSRHKFSDDLPPISVSLDRLREPLNREVVGDLEQG